MLLSPCITCIPTVATVHEPTEQWQIGERGWLVSTRQAGHLIHLIIKTLLCLGHPLVGIDTRHKHLHIFYLFREIIHISLTQNSSPLIFQLCSFQIPDHPAEPLAVVHELVYNHTSSHCYFQAKWSARCTVWISAHWEDFLSLLSFRIFQEGAVVL